ncbi:F0F1-type ATP synthase, beta subunit [Saprospira grandis DSM 2844]|uniref:F0F1-type ATP synthase, beta subunit n=1 Tax=Saprospira grandis DSM 2844 TaxID=694433 RepID=J0P3E7_9BACT|nr:AsmA-like C-terminal region-containing protein [Saprospira grandis]EJF51937.1 F0F1-type ATP synthase, beta subunit [Saprospira grandis DSM 2844]
MKKWIKYSLIGLFSFLILFVLAAITLPMIFKEDIEKLVKEAANEQLNATLDFEGTELSLLWTFPNFAFDLKGLKVTGQEEFDGLKLADVKRISLRLNLFQVISGNYAVNSLVFEEPKFYVKVLKNGKANYDIMKTDSSATVEEETSSSESSDFQFALRSYQIIEGEMTYDDAPNAAFLQIKGLNHKGSGDMSLEQFDFYTSTQMQSLQLNYDGVSYLNKAVVDAEINIGVGMKEGEMSFKLLDNALQLNALKLGAEGTVLMKGDDIIFEELKFSAPNNNFASLLSMLPAAYIEGFESVKTSGDFSLNGAVNGTFNEKSYPAFNMALKAANGTFQYPDLPMGVSDIGVDLKVNSPSSDLDKLTVDLKQFAFKLGQNPFSASLFLKTPMSDPDIKSAVEGKINLAELSKAFPMEGSSMAGLIEAQLQANTRMSYVTEQKYEKVDMQGKLGIENMIYLMEGMPDIRIKKMLMLFSPNDVDLQAFDLTMGKSDIQAQGKLDNLLTYFSGDKIMTGKLKVTSRLLDLNELMGDTTTTSEEEMAATNMTDTTSSINEDELFDRWDFAADFSCDKMVYDVYEMKNMKAVGKFSPSRAKMSNFELLINKVDIKADGQLDNVFGYLFKNELLKGELNLYSNYMNVNQFMTEDGSATEPEAAPAPADPSTAETAFEPILVPANIDFHMKARFKKFIYDVYQLDNVAGDLRVYEEKVEMTNLSCNAFGGSIILNGEYNSQDPKAPKFDFAYDVAQLDFAKIAEGVPLVATFAPIMKGMLGKFNSKFSLNGILEPNLYPDMASLNSEGLLETFDAVLKGSTPLKGLSQKMGIKALENIEIQNTRNFFKIKDGKLTVEPFAFTQKGIDMTFGGAHGLDQTMDYDLKMRVPKAMIDNSVIGGATQAAGNLLASQASKLGIKVEEAAFINFAVDITGNLSNPKFSPKVLGAEGKSGESMGDQVKDNLKEEAEKLKAEAEEKVKAEAERLKAEVEERARKEAERLAEEAKERARKEAERLAAQAASSEEAKRIRDSIETAAKEAADKILQDKLNNPFGNKNPFKRNK